MSAIHGTLVALGARVLDTVHGEFVVHAFRNLVTREHVLAVARGDVTTAEPLLARIHSSCVTSESYGSGDCDCAQQLDAALARVARAGRGIVFYLMQEGRGAGFVAKARDRMLVQASGNRLTTFDAYAQMGLSEDGRRYDDVGFACRLLGVTAPLALLTNNPGKLAAVEATGVRIATVLPLREAPSPLNVQYLAAKSRSGHALPDAATAAAPLPAPVACVDPAPLPEAPQLLHVASYLLPVLAGGAAQRAPHWFWLHAYLDRASGREHVVLAYGSPGASALVRVQPVPLLERFMVRSGGPHRRRWDAAVRTFVGHGSGCALLEPLDDVTPGAAPATADATVSALLARQLGGRRARP
ncbi:MAG TPA: GTP cyclohydrolase II, partial [Candidatus Limnocylindria bacterium]|nr:GTP cyclohydrolase II [Candidatus Limnocylindria bacterium]